MIKITNIMAATISVGKRLNHFQEQQIARKIEKFLLKESIVCEYEVIEDGLNQSRSNL